MRKGFWTRSQNRRPSESINQRVAHEREKPQNGSGGIREQDLLRHHEVNPAVLEYTTIASAGTN